jgi:hypothetical protein
MDKEIKPAQVVPISEKLRASEETDAVMMSQVHQIKKQLQTGILASGEFLKGMGDGEVQFVQETGQSLLIASQYYGDALCGKNTLGADIKEFRTAIENTSQQALGTAGDYYFSQLPNGQANLWHDIGQARDAITATWNSLDPKQKGHFFGKEAIPWAVPGAVGIMAKEIQGTNLIGKTGQAIATSFAARPIMIYTDTRVPAFIGVENPASLPAFENKSFDDFIAKMTFFHRDAPMTRELSGRVFPFHTTDSSFAKEGDIGIVWKERTDGTPGFRAYTNIWTNGKWLFADFFNNTMASLYFADNEKTIIKKSDQFIEWLRNYKGKIVHLEEREGGYSQYKLAESHRPSDAAMKQIALNIGTDKLPVNLTFNNKCRFGSKPPSANSTDGSIWFKCPEGTKGKPLVGDWEAHVNVRGQWFKCKIEHGAIKEDLSHFESKDEAFSKAGLINDAMQKGKFSIELLGRENDAKAPINYLLRKLRE